MTEDSLRAELRDHIRVALAIGADDFDAVVAASVDRFDRGAQAHATAAEIAAEEFAAYRSEQGTWPDVLDSDRLVRAFRALDVSGVVARVDFTCCQSCGTAEIRAEVPEGAVARGYAFCHRQDIEAGVRGAGLHVSYGAFAPGEGPAGAVEIGREVVTALREHGLTAHWDGDAARRIHVPLTWRRRRFGRLAAWPGATEPAGAGPLTVTSYDHVRRTEDQAVPVSFEEGRQRLLDLTPRDGNFVAFEGRSGRVLQAMWQAGPRLWLESPDVAARCSRGRHVTLDEAEELLRVLATEGRLALDRLGDLQTVAWSAG
ncbi:MAG: DUF6891 domain-containing protein [Actinomadura sp.]